jgi:hypothetical protein
MSSLKPLVKTIFIIGLFFLLTIAGFFIWWHLPVTINRHSDIKFGNQLIKNIDTYKTQHGLPKTNDWATLKTLGFKDNGDFFVPDYQKINDTTYELTYIEGFDGPYLLWNSNDRRWKKAMPTLSTENTEEKVLNLVEQQKIVKDEIKLIDSLSSGQRHITLLPTLDDTAKNIYLIRVGEDNGTNLVMYFNFLVDANTMTIINPTGKLEGQ